MLPEDKEPSTSSFVGAEPQLVHAVCQGIRAQGCGVAHPSNLCMCRPLIHMLRKDKIDTSAALKLLESLPNPAFDAHCEKDIDYLQMKTHVMETFGQERLIESPLAFFERCPRNLLIILPRSILQ